MSPGESVGQTPLPFMLRERWKHASGKPAAIEVPELLPDAGKPGTIRFVRRKDQGLQNLEDLCNHFRQPSNRPNS
jgi:hypothetical protein